jgi:predicted nucleotidyltransferase component of viral defense system
MNIAERLARYEERGFSRETAAVNVLIEEALQVLFSSFPDTFVFFGGASLVLFYASPRHSGDLDLLARHETPPSADELMRVLEQPLRASAEALGFAAPTIEPARTTREFLKLVVKVGTQVLFTIDLTRISAVIRSELVDFPIPSDSTERTTVPVASRNLQLLFKAEAFLRRPIVKARDAFDIKLLRDFGAALDNNLKAHLTDGPAAEKLEDAEFLAKRIDQVNPRSCKPELQPHLPKHVYEELERADFEQLREALRELFSEWL